jgi:hypothetical protein
VLSTAKFLLYTDLVKALHRAGVCLYKNPSTGKVVTTILHTFGRKDRLDLSQIKRLVDQLIQYLDTGERPELLSGLEITNSWDLGGTHLLDGIWRELGRGVNETTVTEGGQGRPAVHRPGQGPGRGTSGREVRASDQRA